jgi:hypothetical protein
MWALPVHRRQYMDIAKWVQGVVAEDQRHNLPEIAGLPDFLKPRQPIEEPVGKARNPPRPSRSSSFLEPAVPAVVEGGARDGRRRRRGETTVRSDDWSSKGTLSSRTASDTDELGRSNDRYERKSRRRTHEDRYKLGSGKKHRRKKRKSDSEETSQNQRQRDEGQKRRKHVTERGKHFHASNVARERLTVRGLLYRLYTDQ